MEVEKLEKLYDLLSKWLTWQKAGVILIGIGLVFGIATYLLPFFQDGKSIERNMDSKVLRKEIDRNISKIRKEFCPDKIPDVLDNSFDVKLIKEFQKAVLEYTFCWEQLESESLHELGLRIKDYTFAYYHFETKKAIFFQKQKNVDSIMILLFNYGNANGVDYNYNNTEATLLADLAKEHAEMLRGAYEIVEKRNEETNIKFNVRKIDENNDTLMMYKVYDEYYKNCSYLDSIKLLPSYYEFDSSYFRFLLNMNKKYMLRIKEYESKAY